MKDKKVNLDNLEIISLIENSDDIDQYTKNFLSNIKNLTFKNNILDLENKKIVNSIYLKKKSKIGRHIETMIWQFYRHRGKKDVNQIIKQYGRDNLIINYSINSNKVVDKNKVVDTNTILVEDL